MRKARRILRGFLDILFPASCAYCNGTTGDSAVSRFCTVCWNDFAMLPSPTCPSCSRPFESPAALESSPAHVCSECRKHPPQFDQAVAIGQFEGPLREAIHQYKYRPCRSLGRPLGAWLSQNISLLPGVDMVIPVPLHTTRLRKRGFNQALLLAHEVHKKHAIPLSYDNLFRTRPTRPQVELKADERARNVAAAFALKRPEEVKAKHIVVVDDVFTTGATLNECASVLKSAGAAQVVALTLARTV